MPSLKVRLAVNTGAGSWSVSSNGTVGDWYAYAHKEEIKVLHDQGVRAVRLGGIHQRFLDHPTATVFNPRVAAAVEAARYARSLGMTVYQQMHEYGYGWGATLTHDTAKASARCFEPFAEFKGDAGFVPCSWNEPKAFTAAAYWPIVNTWRQAIRDYGWTQRIGISAANWAGIGQIHEQIKDIIALGDKNILVEGHYYHDTGLNNWNWSGPGVSRNIWNITDAMIDDGSFKAICDRNFSTAYEPAFKELRAAGIPLIIGETSLPFGKVGNAVRRYMLPKWEANADVLVDRILWCAAQHMDPNDANALFFEQDGVKVDGTRGRVPVPNALFLDELAARAEYEGTALPAPAPSIISVNRIGPETITEGQTMALQFTIGNGKVGQSFTIVQEGEMGAVDFGNTLAQSFAGIAGISYAQTGATSGKVTLTRDGDFTFTINRPTVADGVLETTDKAGWVAGNQEQTNFKILDLTGGLMTSTGLISNWVTDTGGTAPTPPTPPVPPVVPTPPVRPTPTPAPAVDVAALRKSMEAALHDANLAENALGRAMRDMKAAIAKLPV